MEKHDTEKLERTLRECGTALRRLAEKSASEVEELIKIIHRPGWTTIAEAIYAEGLARLVLAQANAVGSLVDVLAGGSRAVG